MSLESATILLQLSMGLALFLLGMSQLEAGIHTIGYDTFKRWLIRSTSSAAGSVSVGIGLTAVLQSSSMVSLLVLAFASAGVLPLLNAVGVLLGANLGTTITGWMVATIGFKLSLQLFAVPLMSSGALLQLLPGRRATIKAMGTLLFGFGLLIFGLDIMKSAVEEISLTWDLSALQGRGLWLYFIVGAAIAGLIQSSSATMMMTLAALHGGLFDLQSAAALIIGADLGTTSTTALGSIGGHYIKRQLALAHVVFNLVVDTAAFFIVLPLLPWLMTGLGLTDPLFSLVAFHSIFNIFGLLLFVPLLQPYSRWVGTHFNGQFEGQQRLSDVPASIPDAALVATAGVVEKIRLDGAALALQTFQIKVSELDMPDFIAKKIALCDSGGIALDAQYQDIKRLESELIAFTMDLVAQPLTPEQVTLLTRQGSDARAVVYSSKTLKDIRHNLSSLQESSLPAVAALYERHRSYIRGFYARYLRQFVSESNTSESPVKSSLLEGNEAHMLAANNAVREIAASDLLTGIELSNMLNVNREVHHAIKNLIVQLES